MCRNQYTFQARTSATASICFTEESTRTTFPTATPRILTGVSTQIPRAWENSNTAWYFLNCNLNWKPPQAGPSKSKESHPRNNKQPNTTIPHAPLTKPEITHWLQCLLPNNPRGIENKSEQTLSFRRRWWILGSIWGTCIYSNKFLQGPRQAIQRQQAIGMTKGFRGMSMNPWIGGHQSSIELTLVQRIELWGQTQKCYQTTANKEETIDQQRSRTPLYWRNSYWPKMQTKKPK